MRRQILLVALAVGLIASGGSGQGAVVPVRIDSGTLVRMTPQIGAPFEGRLVQPVPAAGSVLITCRYPGPPCSDPTDSAAIRRIQTASLLRLEVQHGNHAGSGALLGGAIGVVFGFLGSSFARGFCDTQDCLSSANTAPLRGGLLGAAIGGLFGWASPRWGHP
jgi:hypothetical protein